MSRFHYVAERGGETYTGVAEAHDRFELYATVRREGGRIVSFTEENADSMLSLQYWNARIGTIKEYDKVLMARNLGSMLSAGLVLARALAVLERQTKNPRLVRTIQEIASSVRRGDTLHEAASQYPKVFSPLFVAMVRAGEEGGDLSGSLAVVADQMERMYALKKKIRSALIYPVIILIAIVGIGALMMIKVVPTLAKTFEDVDAKLPLSTQMIISTSNFLIEYTSLALLLVFGAIAAAYFGLRTERGKIALDFVLLHTPLIGNLVREINAARTSRTLASLLASGVDVISALEITADVVQNHYFKNVLKDASRSIGAGEPLSAAFVRNEHLYPPFVGEMMSVGEETGALAEMLKRLALYYEDEVDRKTKDMSTVVEPFLMIVIGAAVGFFAVSMIAPIYQLTQNI